MPLSGRPVRMTGPSLSPRTSCATSVERVRSGPPSPPAASRPWQELHWPRNSLAGIHLVGRVRLRRCRLRRTLRRGAGPAARPRPWQDRWCATALARGADRRWRRLSGDDLRGLRRARSKGPRPARRGRDQAVAPGNASVLPAMIRIMQNADCRILPPVLPVLNPGVLGNAECRERDVGPRGIADRPSASAGDGYISARPAGHRGGSATPGARQRRKGLVRTLTSRWVAILAATARRLLDARCCGADPRDDRRRRERRHLPRLAADDASAAEDARRDRHLRSGRRDRARAPAVCWRRSTPTLPSIQVVVMNYDAPDERWPADLKSSFEQYVKERRRSRGGSRGRQRVPRLGGVQRDDRRRRLARANRAAGPYWLLP